MTATPSISQIPCPVCSGKCALDTDTAGSSTTKGEPQTSSQPWHTRARRWLSCAGDQVLEAMLASGTYRIT